MNKKLQKQKIRQKRQMKRSQKRKVREKKVLNTKRTGQKKPALKKVTNMKSVVVRKIRRLSCFIGIHDWKLCSGREGNPMFTCIKCWKGSKMKWGPGGSEKHYKEKAKGQMEIANPKNWEKKGKDYYFKGKYVKLSKEEVRKLEVMLGKRKDKRLMKIK